MAELRPKLVVRGADAAIAFYEKALGAKRKDVVISTKVGFRTDPAMLHQGLSRQNILAECDNSLRRLGTDYIDIYLVHRVDLNTPIEETVAALETLVKAGKVRYTGFSNWSAWMAAKAVGIQNALGASSFRAAELYYSLVGRDFENELEPFCRDAGIGVLVWSPLAGGLLTGKYSRENPQGDGGRLGLHRKGGGAIGLRQFAGVAVRRQSRRGIGAAQRTAEQIHRRIAVAAGLQARSANVHADKAEKAEAIVDTNLESELLVKSAAEGE